MVQNCFEYVNTEKSGPPICISQALSILSLRQLMLSASCYPFMHLEICIRINSFFHLFLTQMVASTVLHVAYSPVYKELSLSFFFFFAIEYATISLTVSY